MSNSQLNIYTQLTNEPSDPHNYVEISHFPLTHKVIISIIIVILNYMSLNFPSHPCCQLLSEFLFI